MSEFVRNAWYPAAWSREVGKTPEARRILGDPVVVYRAASGKVFALDDACPHRLAPLSYGKIKGEALECGYHGMTFDGAGRCIRIPGQDTIPQRAHIRHYPIVERYNLCWIWMGDPARADAAQIYQIPSYGDPAYDVLEGDALRIDCNYLSLADNLCDPAHVSFVHLSSLGGASGESVPVKTERTGPRKMVTWRWTLNSEPVPILAGLGRFKGNVDRWQYYHFDAPSIAVIDFGSADAGTGAPEGNRKDCVQMWACHFLTPVDGTHSIDYWLFVKNFRLDERGTEAFKGQLRAAFKEDKDILEALQVRENERPDFRPVRLALDTGVTRMRSMVQEMIEAERGTRAGSAA